MRALRPVGRIFRPVREYFVEFTTILQAAEAEFEEKKSRFIGRAYPVESEDEARARIEEAKRRYWDATHNVFAYRIGWRPEVQRFSDDGEPGGTAGMPVLEVLRGEKLNEVLVIVTRYFGGTLLGTGGLVRAYTRAAQEAVRAAGVIRKEVCRRCRLMIDYTQLGKLQYALNKNHYWIENTEYADRVGLSVIVPESQQGAFKALLTDLGEGQLAPVAEERLWAARQGEAYVFFPESQLLLPDEPG